MGRFGNEQTGLDEAQAASSQRSDNRWHVGETPGQATVWVVIRDSRGGTGWRVQTFDIVP